MATLADYRTTLRDLLHDDADVLYPIASKDRWINDGLKKRNQITGGYRQIFTVACSIATDTYSFTQLGSARILDIIGISLINGTRRTPLFQASLTTLNARWRQFTSQMNIPEAYAWAGQSVILNCIASSASFSLEVDCTTGSTALTLSTDEDPLPDPWTEPVPYWAAHRAKLNARRRAEADAFKEDFFVKCAEIPGARVGLLPSPYGGRR